MQVVLPLDAGASTDRPNGRPSAACRRTSHLPNVWIVLPRIERWMPACRCDVMRKAILEADDRAVVETEAVLGELPERCRAADRA